MGEVPARLVGTHGHPIVRVLFVGWFSRHPLPPKVPSLLTPLAHPPNSHPSAKPSAPAAWRPTASIETLRRRADCLRRVRAFFDRRGFFEVTTPVLSSDTVVDLHLDPLLVTLYDDPRRPGQGRQSFLQTSPEFHMKRLVAAGADAIYQITPAFRAAEQGLLHNIEFSMLEWYRVGDDMQQGMQLLSDFAADFFAAGASTQVSYQDAFASVWGCDPHTAADGELLARAADLRTTTGGDARDDLLDLLWSHGVQPGLAAEQPVIVYDFPASQAALAKVRSDAQGDVAERFELYFRGVELANGYHELTDAEELKRRISLTNQQRRAAGKPALPEENRLLDAMRSGFPPTTGVALGLDRAVMVAIGERKLEKVFTFSAGNA